MASEAVAIHEATRERYLNYALSVITSRALPDVRDGLKPVQRRILYTMFRELSLHPGGRYRKCAAVVGEVMGKYHPHGDQSIYDALVRMAQSFSLLAPLVDGQGNFGSLDGDPPAAMRYTECRLRPIAEELLQEIRQDTVDFRPSYDGQRSEPVCLPAQFPQLLVNGVEGIAVGMATKIPPHNLGEVIDACIALIDEPELDVPSLLRYIRGPDFPTGGRLLSDRHELQEIYTKGQGSFRLRAQYRVEKTGRRNQVVLTSVPYGSNKAKLIERIGEAVRTRKLPQVIDVRDESTDDVRVVLDLKQGALPEAVMAYLYKRTSLECTFSLNMNVLVPTENGDICTPRRVDLKEALEHWLQFRFTTVQRRFEYELRKLLERIHILEGFEIVFADLDEVIRLIRESEGKHDAAIRLMARFDLDAVQTEAILELKLYKLAKLEIQLIQDELEEKRGRAQEIRAILASEQALWDQVRGELISLRQAYAEPRRTEVGGPAKELVFNEDAYIVEEDTYVVVTRDGWMKRQSSFSELNRIRTREGDDVGWLFRASTRSTLTVFTTHGCAYTLRCEDVLATTGYGTPLQSVFTFTDGERVVGVISHDARHALPPRDPPPDSDAPPPPYCVAVTRGGRIVRVCLAAYNEPSTRSGRRYARLNSSDTVLATYVASGAELISVATRNGRAMVFALDEVPILRSAGKGTMGIKLRDDDEVMAFELAFGARRGARVITGLGRELRVTERKFGLSKRGGRGNVVLRRGTIDIWQTEPEVLLGPVTQAESE
jgi:DNA gyrase subunit A